MGSGYWCCCCICSMYIMYATYWCCYCCKTTCTGTWRSRGKMRWNRVNFEFSKIFSNPKHAQRKLWRLFWCIFQKKRFAPQFSARSCIYVSIQSVVTFPYILVLVLTCSTRSTTSASQTSDGALTSIKQYEIHSTRVTPRLNSGQNVETART